ncbi:MAG: RsmE family RNA methyltransferase, partial [Parachlamydiaceae bacterium]
IVQGIPRLNRIYIILEKGCELGMTEIIFYAAELSEKTAISENQFKRFETILINAMKQSGRLYLPKITLMNELESIVQKNGDKSQFYGDVGKEALPLIKYDLKGGIVFYVGPEKGFSDSEEKKLKSFNVKGVSLSQNVLRTDTAPLAALAIISQMRL